MKSILVVDDEKSIRESLTGILQDEGFTPTSVDSGEKAIEKISEDRPDLILLDIWMPGMDGLETLTKIRDIYPDQLVVMMSGHGTIETAVRSTKLGAYDFIEKPLSLEKVLLCIQNAVKIGQLVEENRELKAQIGKEHEMIGSSKLIKELKKQIRIAAPTSGWILITGENGTGKELVARSIHHHSQRYDKPFVEVNCAAIPEELIESELFGHEKGSFTGATTQRRGKFDQAHQGTLFLDEIGDMSLKTQAKVLRVLQDGEVEPVGAGTPFRVDVRVIAATNKDLVTEVQQGRFREDLYYRLAVVMLHTPALREHPDDIPLLVTHFTDHYCQEYNRRPKTWAEVALAKLQRHPWPGNIRELKNVVERAVIMELDDTIGHIELAARPTSGGLDDLLDAASLSDFQRASEIAYLMHQLDRHGWNVAATARAIGTPRSNLYKKMQAYDIKRQEP